jgi:uncharacterized radical SAM protein YgiQ
MPDFRGTISDLGGPSANMYAMGGRDPEACGRCKRPACLFPAPCPNLVTDHAPLLDLYERVRRQPGVKHCFISSGIRHDLFLQASGDARVDATHGEYLDTLLRYHVPGRLKVAPEHVADPVLRLMRKPSFARFRELAARLDAFNRREGRRLQLVPYFISSHPGCGVEEMAELAIATRDLHFHLEQVQDFTPTPMTLATEIYHAGLHPYTLRPVTVARSAAEKRRQNLFFFWYKKENRREITDILRSITRPDLLRRLFPS